MGNVSNLASYKLKNVAEEVCTTLYELSNVDMMEGALTLLSRAFARMVDEDDPNITYELSSNRYLLTSGDDESHRGLRSVAAFVIKKGGPFGGECDVFDLLEKGSHACIINIARTRKRKRTDVEGQLSAASELAWALTDRSDAYAIVRWVVDEIEDSPFELVDCKRDCPAGRLYLNYIHGPVTIDIMIEPKAVSVGEND